MKAVFYYYLLSFLLIQELLICVPVATAARPVATADPAASSFDGHQLSYGVNNEVELRSLPSSPPPPKLNVPWRWRQVVPSPPPPPLSLESSTPPASLAPPPSP
ncbi:hypothetical protein ACH5RR_019119 [Cinchona calisaya]|uniref:Uncharacterized protein n=1 Tax=Cinchona calisaya TaxID=153742 RepID=A0ABD2ZNF8_9GENT